MASKEDQKSSSLSTPKNGSPVTMETFADVLELLEVESLDVEPWAHKLVVESTNELIADHGVDWICQHRVQLIQELEHIIEM